MSESRIQGMLASIIDQRTKQGKLDVAKKIASITHDESARLEQLMRGRAAKKANDIAGAILYSTREDVPKTNHRSSEEARKADEDREVRALRLKIRQEKAAATRRAKKEAAEAAALDAKIPEPEPEPEGEPAVAPRKATTRRSTK
jgi:hypothetical protein